MLALTTILFALFLQSAIAGVSVIQRNGVVDIFINHKKIDMNEARVVEETPEYTVYEPAENKDVRIIFGKNGGIMITENGTTQIMVGAVGDVSVSSSSVGRPMTPEEQAMFEQNMKQLDINMKQLEMRLGNLGNQINRHVQQSLAKAFGPTFFNSFWDVY
uniref:Venom protein family 10 protein 2 n=1 Tax=Pristhesancus plagipennis TaxID=1955184 RepID=A0A2K8JLL1_PRIPG|nr:venom protein family 10 protein 2 [Pristhesancus plagipennis]